MARMIGRRDFFKTGARAGLALALGRTLAAAAGRPVRAVDVGVGIGEDRGRAAAKAVELVGRMARFVPKGASCSWPTSEARYWARSPSPGSCGRSSGLRKKAGGGDQLPQAGRRSSSGRTPGSRPSSTRRGLAQDLQKDELLFKAVVLAGQALKEARVLAAFYDHDVFINLPITKDHAGNKFTGAMKNLMGLNSPVNNRTFHRPNWKMYSTMSPTSSS